MIPLKKVLMRSWYGHLREDNGLTGSGKGVLIFYSRSFFHKNATSQTSFIAVPNIIFFPNPHCAQFWRILLPAVKNKVSKILISSEITGSLTADSDQFPRKSYPIPDIPERMNVFIVSIPNEFKKEREVCELFEMDFKKSFLLLF